MVEKLQEALIASGARTLDLLRKWDTSGNNTISMNEFKTALLSAGCPADKNDIQVGESPRSPDGVPLDRPLSAS